MLAPAKINAMLHVTGKRDDGYHRLQSLVLFADIGDELSYTPSPDFSLTIAGPFAATLGDAEDNLVMRAAQSLAAHAGIAPHGALHLTKNLPPGAGLGGGSSDAAAALRLLNERWRCEATEGELIAIAAPLGSDIPACLMAAPLWMEETGHKITPLLLNEDLHAVLAYPAAALSTRTVYQALKTPYDIALDLPATFADNEALLTFLAQSHNSLEAPARALEPEIGHVLAALAEQEACQLARMSGSGSCCFALFASAQAAQHAAQRLALARPSWWIRPAMLKASHG